MAAACGDGSGPPPPVASVSLSQSSATLVPGASVTLVATLLGTDAKPLLRPTLWSTSDASVATVTAGVVTAVAPGKANITASATGVAGTAEVTVKEGGVILPTGAAFQALGGAITISAPAGVVAAAAQIIVDPATVSGIPRLVSGTAYVITPSASVSGSLNVGIKYDPTKLAAGSSEPGLKVYALNGGNWERIAGSTVDTASDRVSSLAPPSGTIAVFELAPAAAQINLGAAQTAAVNTAVAVAPSVKIVDVEGFAVPNIPVVFTVASGAGTVTGGTTTTGANGIATVGSWKLGTVAGANTLTATVTGASGGPLTFSATAVAGAPVSLTFITTPPTTVQSKIAFPTIPSVQVTDAFGNPVLTAGVPVTVAVSAGGATLEGTKTQNTNASGVASFPGLVLSGNSGQKTLAFTAGNLPALTSFVNLTGGVGAAVVVHAGNTQTVVAGSTVPVQPAVRVTDASGDPVAELAVTFAITSGAGNLTGAEAVTDANGIARVGSWVVGKLAGANTLTAVASGLASSPVTFTATGTPGLPASVTLTQGNGQTAPAGRGPKEQIFFQVLDANGNGVPNVDVSFSVLAGGGTVVPAAKTLSNGVAVMRGWTFGPTPGAQAVRATVVGQSTLGASVNATAVTLRIVTFGDSNTDHGYLGKGFSTVSYVSPTKDRRPAASAGNASTQLAGKIEILWSSSYSPSIVAVNHGVGGTGSGSARGTSGAPSARTVVNGVTRFGAEVLGLGAPWNGGEPVNEFFNEPIVRERAFAPTINDFAYISIGTNDQVFNITPTQTIDNLAFMIDYWAGLGYPADHLILTTLAPPARLYSDAIPGINRAIRALAASKGTKLIDIAAHTSNDDGVTWKNSSLHVGDETHYTETVRDWIAAKVVEILVAATASPQ